MLSKKFFGRKKAGITVEVTLSIVLAVLVLFLTLGLFSGNLKTLVENGGIQTLFDKDASADKIAYNPKEGDPTATQVNVQVVAEQGLEWYLTQAQEAIQMYKENPPTTQEQIEDLAKAATIAKILGKLENADEAAFYKAYGIDIQTGRNKTFVKDKFIGYYSENSLNAVKEITDAAFN